MTIHSLDAALYETHTLATPSGPRTLAIELEPGPGAVPAHELTPKLHEAIDAWNRDHPESFVRSDLVFEPEAGSVRRSLRDYLYASGAVNGDRLSRHLSMLHERGRIHTFTLRPGAPVEGPDLVGRGRVVELLRQRLRESSVHLMAPRRYGKTSLLRHLQRSLAREGVVCLYVDISPGRAASWLLVALTEEAMENDDCRRSLAALPELAGWPEPGSGYAERTQAGRQLAERLGAGLWSFGQRLLEALGDARAVLLLDEFSVFLRRILDRDASEAKALVELLARSRTADVPTRQVLAGSAGLSSYVHFQGLDEAFADLEELILPPLERRDAADLVEELLYGEQVLPSPEVVSAVLDEIGEPIPYFLHALIHAALEECRDGGGDFDGGLVRRAYREILLGPRGNPHFREYQIAHQPYPAELREAAARLLREMARSPEGVEEERLAELFATAVPGGNDQFQPLLSCLREDYDLVTENGRWKMRSKVLRDRWAQDEPWLTGGS